MDSETDSESDLPLSKLKSFKSEAMEFKTFIEKIRIQKADEKKIYQQWKSQKLVHPNINNKKKKTVSPYLHPL